MYKVILTERTPDKAAIGFILVCVFIERVIYVAELDRNALLIYLNDLRVMETIIHESNLVNREINEDIKAIKDHYNWVASDKPSKPKKVNYQSEKDEASNFGYGGIITAGALMILGLLLIVILINNFSWEKSSIFALFGIVILVFTVIFLAILFFALVKQVDIKKQKLQDILTKEVEQERRMEKYQKDLDAHKVKLNKKYKEMQSSVKKANDEAAKVQADINNIKYMLDNAYSANIIPMQFRNIQGVYYLYDYLSTSNQTLSEALVQCNLEAIKQKLDKMIQLQSAMIIQQAQTNAKLDRIVEQNDQILETALKTMYKTAEIAEQTKLSAQYAKISAANSELTVMLAQEQLTYQKAQLNYISADFWRK